MKQVPLWRVIAFNLSFVLWSIAISVAGLPLLIFWRSRTPIMNYLWSVPVLWLLKTICGITYKVRGLEHYKPNQVIVASKHQSAMDIAILSHMFYKSAFVLKRELTWIPIWGWYFVRMGMIAINRKKGREALGPMLAQSRRIIQQGRVIVIFPEGTRTTPGAKGRWNPGVGMIYDELKVPMLPIAHNSGLFWPRNYWKKFSGELIVECLPIVPAGLSIRAAVKQLEEQVETATQRLYEEAHAPK